MDHQVKVRGFRIELEEIERVIESHRCVRRAAVKVIGAGTAGEQLAAYVAADSAFQVQSLQRDLCKQLPAFKRPVSITVLDELPVGTSGKVLRDQLPMPTVEGPVGGGVVEPGSDLERFLVERLSATLGQETIGVDDNFFEAGGTSLQAAILTSDLSGELGVSIPASMMFDLGDVKSIARRLSELHQPQLRDRFGDDSIQLALQSGSMPSEESLLVQWKPAGTQPPIFMVHPPGGIVLCYRELASHLSDAQPLIAIRARGLYGDEPLPQTLAEMAADYVRAIRSRNPSGPYWIGGWSLGGVVAFEVARQLVVDGSEVSGLILLDSTLPERSDSGGETAGLEYGIDLSLSQLSELSGEDQLPYLYRHAEQLGVLDSQAPAEVVKKVIEDLRILFAHHVDLCQAYELEAVNVPVLLVRPSKVPGQADARPDRGWGQWTGKVTVGHVAGHHHSMVQGQGAIEIAQQLQSFVSR
jgi:thioesterase domain-containing protein/acyl carrier protein